MPMKFFNLDLHISVIRDVKSILFQLYPEIEVVNWSISGHSFLTDGYHETKIINKDTWKNIDLKMIEQFNAEYGSFLEQFDGFIVTHTPVFALLYEKYNKPIIMVNSCRYEQPFCWNTGSFSGRNAASKEMQIYLETKLAEMHQKKQLISICNNLADAEYLRLGTGINSIHIPSICSYTEAKSIFEDGKYREQSSTFTLIDNKCCEIRSPLTIFDDANNLYILKGDRIFPKMDGTAYLEDALSSGYKYNQLFSYKGIIHMPHEISTMSISEQYTANVPLFFPSKHFLKTLVESNRIKFYGPYLKNDYNSAVEPALGNKWIDFWIDRADYYNETNMPYITYYNSFEELKTITETYDEKKLKDISERMKEKNRERKFKAYRTWSDVMNQYFSKQLGCKLLSGHPSGSGRIDKSMFEYKFNGEEVITTDKFLNLINGSERARYIKIDVLFNNSQITWRGQQHPSVYPFSKTHLLLTGHGDYSVTDKMYEKYKDKCDYWLGTNIDTEKNNLIKYPLGITNDCNDSPIHHIYGNIDIMTQVAENKNITKSGIIYCNINVSTHTERKLVYQIFSEKKFVTVATSESTLSGRKKFLEDIRKHKFVLCPRGNGPDTHRLWETLYMGSIPVVKFEEAYSSFTNLPIFFILDWEELRNKEESFYQEKYDEIMKRSWHLNRINFSYWRNLITHMLQNTESIDRVPVELKQHNIVTIEDPKGIWDQNELNGYNNCTVNNSGQINLDSLFGKIIKDMSMNLENKTFLEIGTWNGLGSTRCFVDGFKSRPSSDFIFYSLECNVDKCRDAQRLYNGIDRVHILNEVLYNNEPTNIYSIFPELSPNYKGNNDFSKWYRVDVENMKKCRKFLDRKDLPEIFDVILLDGGEFTTYFEFQTIKDRCRVLLLDDTNTNKCRKIVEEIKKDSSWEILIDRPNERNGWLICMRKDI